MNLTQVVRAGLLVLIASGGVSMAAAEDARPQADEQCVARCDTESDKCMAKADNEAEAQKCDDKYSACLEKCR